MSKVSMFLQILAKKTSNNQTVAKIIYLIPFTQVQQDRNNDWCVKWCSGDSGMFQHTCIWDSGMCKYILFQGLSENTEWLCLSQIVKPSQKPHVEVYMLMTNMQKQV